MVVRKLSLRWGFDQDVFVDSFTVNIICANQYITGYIWVLTLKIDDLAWESFVTGGLNKYIYIYSCFFVWKHEGHSVSRLINEIGIEICIN